MTKLKICSIQDTKREDCRLDIETKRLTIVSGELIEITIELKNAFTDLIIDISLFRPGPVKSDMITPFLNARQGSLL